MLSQNNKEIKELFYRLSLAVFFFKKQGGNDSVHFTGLSTIQVGNPTTLK